MKQRKNGTITVIVPVYNEVATIRDIILRIRKFTVSPVQLIVVDDASTDGTQAVLRRLKKQIDVLLEHKDNQGKGAAIATAQPHVRGDVVVLQDADLEYDPAEYLKLVQPIFENKADAVYGSRFVGSEAHRVVYFWHSVANAALTMLSNSITNINLTDMETGYKVFRASLFHKFQLVEPRFGIDPELTAQMVYFGARIYEVGISYQGRTYAEGKKIGFSDGLRVLFVIIKYGFKYRFGLLKHHELKQ